MGVATSAYAATPTAINIAEKTYGVGETIDIVVTYDEAVNVSNSPYIALIIGTDNPANAVQAFYSAGTGTANITFSYALPEDVVDSNGIVLGAEITAAFGDIVNVSDGGESSTVKPALDTSGVLVDTNKDPEITSVTVPADNTYNEGQNLEFTVNYHENVVVTGTPNIALTIGSASEKAEYVSGSGSSALLFRYVVKAGDEDTDGIQLGSIDLNSGTMQDAAGNNAEMDPSSVLPSTAGVLVGASSGGGSSSGGSSSSGGGSSSGASSSSGAGSSSGSGGANAGAASQAVPVDSPLLMLAMMLGLGWLVRRELRK
ncbi:MAG: hypothetical protein OIF38_13210 [Cellvibrionaceae bacterium]|nr:hypothetical protein [Cellvibrionaceae bacterium]